MRGKPITVMRDPCSVQAGRSVPPPILHLSFFAFSAVTFRCICMHADLCDAYVRDDTGVVSDASHVGPDKSPIHGAWRSPKKVRRLPALKVLEKGRMAFRRLDGQVDGHCH